MSRAVLLAVCVLTTGCTTTATRSSGPAEVSGYLDTDAVRVLASGFSPDPLDLQAEQTSLDAVEPGTDRWWLAIADSELRPPEAAQHFDCALGTRLAGRPRPALTRLMHHLLIDSNRVTSVLALQAPRRRPVAERPELQPCVRMDEASRDSPSWPAGGAVTGAAYGEMFAALAPDRAEAVRRRGNEIGLSRALCRLNWHVDVTDGIRIGRVLYERAAMAPGFEADLQAARVEVAAARAEGLTHPACAAERRALSEAGDQAGRGATSAP